MNYPSAEAVVAAVVAALNERADTLGYGPHARASIPVKVEDVLTPPVIGGGSSHAADACRCMACWILWQHVRVWDNFAARWRPMSCSAIGARIDRKKTQVSMMVRKGCEKRRNPVYKGIYDAALDKLRAQGYDLWMHGPIREC